MFTTAEREERPDPVFRQEPDFARGPVRQDGGSGLTTMPIAEQGYAHWTGTFVERRFPWWPITRLGIRLAFKRKFFKFALRLLRSCRRSFSWPGSISPSGCEDFQFMVRGRQSIDFLKVNPAFFRSYFTSGRPAVHDGHAHGPGRRGPHRRRPEIQLPPALFLPAAAKARLPRGKDVDGVLFPPDPDPRPRPALHPLQAHLRRELQIPGRFSLAPALGPRLFARPHPVFLALTRCSSPRSAGTGATCRS